MKRKYILIFLVFIIGITLFGQSNNSTVKKGDSIFYNQYGREKLKAEATQYGIIDSIYIIKSKTNYRLKVYGFNKEDLHELKFETNTEKLAYIKPIGKTVHYYSNGNILSETTISKDEGGYIKTHWYADGSKMKENRIYYSAPLEVIKPDEIINFWDKDGTQHVKNGKGKYTYFNKKDSIRHQGSIKKGIKNGEWTAYYTNGKNYYKEFYNKGKLESGTSWDKGGKSYNYTKQYEPSKFKDGQKSIKKYLLKNFKVPKSTVKAKVDGTIVIAFQVDKNGNTNNLRVLKKVHPDADRAALETIRQMKSWIPAKYKGQIVKTNVSLPITFKLN